MPEQKDHHSDHSAHSHQNSSHHKKKVNWARVSLVLGIIIAALLFYFLLLPLIKNSSQGASSLTAGNIKLDYVIKLEDGTVIAQNSSAFSAGQIGSTFGFASTKLDDAVKDMKEGQKKTIKLSPADAFGEYNQSYVAAINRTTQIKRAQEQNRTIEVPISSAKQAFGEDPQLNKEYDLEGAPWKYKVIAINNDTVTISQEAQAGQFVPGDEILFANVTQVTSSKITLLLSAEEQTKNTSYGNITITLDKDYIYFKTTPLIGSQIVVGFFPAKVLSFNETSIIVDYNPDYAGQKIIVEIKVLEIGKKSTASSLSNIKMIAGAPTLDAFIVSQCPFGLQMQRILVPVAEALNGKANIIVRYIGDVSNGKVTSMHGDKEAQENLRQICIREEQPAKYWDYVTCFIKAGDTEGCLEEAGVDDLSKCMSGAGIEYAEADFNLADEYFGTKNIGSPKLALNGKEADEFKYGGRTANAVKQMVCSAFTDVPAECNEGLETSNAATSFSETYSTGSSGAQAASCG